MSEDSDISYKSSIEKKEPVYIAEHIKDMKNVLFYLNKLQSVPKGDFIDNIHKQWRYDYDKLEEHHGYIQWLFPNFYGSAFNGSAYKLTPEEAKFFRKTPEIAKRLVKSYQLIYNFYGMKIIDHNTGKVARSDHYEKRYDKTLITSLHNHLRVRRILTHMNVVGFRKFAIELVDFLETEIYGSKGGYKHFLEQPRPLKGDYIRKLKNNPLYPLITYDVFKTWRIYGETHNEDQKKRVIQELLFYKPKGL